MKSSIKPEIHYISLRCQRRTKPWPQVRKTHKNLVKIGCVVSVIGLCSQTNRQTDRHGHHNTPQSPLPYRGRSNYAHRTRVGVRVIHQTVWSHVPGRLWRRRLKKKQKQSKKHAKAQSTTVPMEYQRACRDIEYLYRSSPGVASSVIDGAGNCATLISSAFRRITPTGVPPPLLRYGPVPASAFLLYTSRPRRHR